MRKRIITLSELKDGESGVIRHYVNQADYKGNRIEKQEGKLTMISKAGFLYGENFIDVRYPHHFLIELDAI